MSNYPDEPGYSDPDSSRRAAEEIAVEAPALREKIWRHIAALGDAGATCDEVEVTLNMRHQTASARIRELVLAGRLIDNNERRRTRSKRWANVYVVVKPRDSKPRERQSSPPKSSSLSARQLELFL